MIIVSTEYSAKCELCGELFYDDDIRTWAESEETLLEELEIADWLTADGKVICDECRGE